MQDLEEVKKIAWSDKINDYFDGVIIYNTDMHIILIFLSCTLYTVVSIQIEIIALRSAIPLILTIPVVTQDLQSN